MAFLNVNTDALVKYTDKLERANRSAFPVATRTALNSAAFYGKKILPTVAKHKFTTRSPSFFSRMSRVETAKGFDINQMSATLGILPGDEAAENLEAQEFGGQIDDRSFIPMKTSRVSKSSDRMVRKKYQVGKLKTQKIRHVRKGGKAQRSKFIREAFQAGVGGLILYGTTLFRVDRINNKAKGRGKLKLTPLYSYKKGRKVKVAASKFMFHTSKLAANRIDDFYIAAAEKKLIKLGLL